MARLMPWMTAVWKRGMHLGVTSKLVCAFILTNGAVVIGMIVFLHWNFGRGFLDPSDLDHGNGHLASMSPQKNERLTPSKG